MNSFNLAEVHRTLDLFREQIIQEEVFKEILNQSIPQFDCEVVRLAEVAPAEQDHGSNSEGSRTTILRKIEKVIGELLTSLSTGESPVLSYSRRSSWDDVSFQDGAGLHLTGSATTSVRFDAILSVKKFALTVKLLSIIYQLVKDNTYCTKRELYYQHPGLFNTQSVLDDIVDNISCMLAVPRWQLHVLATSKGCIAGDLYFRDIDGNLVDCRNTDTGVLVPNHVTGITNLCSQAKFVLIVEKDASFQKLLDEGFCRKMAPCIIVTGKGFPDVNTRLFVRKLWDSFHLPTLALMDADPHGIEIMAVYKFGSRSLSFETANLAVPAVRWLGVFPSDVQRLNLADDVLLPLTTKGSEHTMEMLARPYVAQNGPLRNELELLLKTTKKAEIQCLSTLSPSFLTDIYIPNKILAQSWL